MGCHCLPRNRGLLTLLHECKHVTFVIEILKSQQIVSDNDTDGILLFKVSPDFIFNPSLILSNHVGKIEG